jgi:SAM-dependent methyltransferase
MSQGSKLDYSRIRLSQDEIQRGAFKMHLGGGAEGWDRRGAFQVELLKRLGLQPDSSLLDFGCGPGRAMTHLVRFLSPGNYWGVDYHSGFIEAARQTARLADLDAKSPKLIVLQRMDFATMGRNFDFILAFSVLNHCSTMDRRAFFRNVASVMSPRTKIIVTHAKWFRQGHLGESGIEFVGSIEFEDLDFRQFGWMPNETIYPILQFTRA